jgi:hypothetical protein
MTCPKHPGYKAIRRPISTAPGCVCDTIYAAAHPLEALSDDRDFWLDFILRSFAVFSCVTGSKVFRLIGWSGRDVAWVEVGKTKELMEVRR